MSVHELRRLSNVHTLWVDWHHPYKRVYRLSNDHLFFCFPSSSSDSVTDSTPSSIARCHCDCVIRVCLQSFYGVAGRAISDGVSGRAISDGGVALATLFLPRHLIALHH